MLEILDKAIEMMKKLTDVGLALLALGVVLQVLFGSSVPFMPVDLVGSIVNVTNQLGSEGLIGLVAVWVLASLYKRS
jgi:hypothetical protein